MRTSHVFLARATAAAAAALVLALGSAAPAGALPPDQFGVYPTWSVAGASGGFTATPSFSPSAAFPAVSVASDATSLSSPTGATNYYNASTAFGAEFGSSRNQPYLLISTAASQAPSTTTFTFAGDQPAGWGFALGDIDADWVWVRAWADEARTQQLTIDQLGFESVGNSCTASPRPAPCSAAGLPFESPVWVTATETFDGIQYAPQTLRGSIASAPGVTLDTAGAYGWFRPTAQVRVLELLFGPRAGFPTYTVTFASPAPKTTITGTLTPPPGESVPPGTAITVAQPDGTPVLDLEGGQLTVPVGPDGGYAIEAEQSDAYLLDPVVPPGYVDPPAFLVDADAAAVTAPPVEIAAVPVDPAPTDDGEAVVEDPDLLAASGGGDAAAAAGVALAGISFGLGVLLVTRRRTATHPVMTDAGVRDRG